MILSFFIQIVKSLKTNSDIKKSFQIKKAELFYFACLINHIFLTFCKAYFFFGNSSTLFSLKMIIKFIDRLLRFSKGAVSK